MLNSHHMSDDEKAEALKVWWKDNGKSIIGGIVIGLALVFGWRFWGDYQVQQAGEASQEYDLFLQAMQTGNLTSANAINDKLKADYSATPYDYFSALDLAKHYVAADDLGNARAQLEYAVSQAEQSGLKAMAEVRLARVMMAQGEMDAAKALAQGNTEAAFAGEFSHILGDIARTEGDHAAALQAYETALANNAANQAFIEMKINQVR